MKEILIGLAIGIVIGLLWLGWDWFIPAPPPRCPCTQAEWNTVHRVIEVNAQQLEICQERYGKEQAWHEHKDSIIRDHWSTMPK